MQSDFHRDACGSGLAIGMLPAEDQLNQITRSMLAMANVEPNSLVRPRTLPLFRQLVASFAIGLAAWPVSSQTLVVSAGTTRNIGAAYLPLYLDALEMQDDSTIVIDDDVVEWRVQIRSARFGARTKIVASGANGSNGQANQTEVPQAGYCESGGQVAPSGENGLPGKNGKAVTMLIGIASLVDLTIIGNGGRGGDGGRGSRGRKGGQASCFCDGGTGGTGGRGGSGGRGGDTSRIRIDWYPVAEFGKTSGTLEEVALAQQNALRAELAGFFAFDGSTKIPARSLPPVIEGQVGKLRAASMMMFPVGLQVLHTPGQGGDGGKGGPEGFAGEGRTCTFWSKGSGAGGVGGPIGSNGFPGNAVQPVVQRIAP